MKIGLIGLPGSGKTTIFNALTKSEARTAAYAGTKTGPNLAVIDVGDKRINRLEEMYLPKKTTRATIEIVDFAGFKESLAGKNDVFSNNLIATMKEMDALAIVVRNFTDDLSETPDPLADIRKIDEDLLLSDMIVAERRLERIEHAYKRGQKTGELQVEEKVLRKICAEGREAIQNLSAEEEKMVRGFQFLAGKPTMVILNSGETNFGLNENILSEIEEKHHAVEFAGIFEMELSRIDNDEEVKMFMEDMGIEESARDRLTHLAYNLLGYISFFTVGSDEVRAWTIRDKDTAVKAAQAIHSDLARGFIRAECFSYDDLIECESEKEVRKRGLFRLEGKNYIVQDGDILNIRFSV
jgi:hypothetical protein